MFALDWRGRLQPARARSLFSWACCVITVMCLFVSRVKHCSGGRGVVGVSGWLSIAAALLAAVLSARRLARSHLPVAVNLEPKSRHNHFRNVYDHDAAAVAVALVVVVVVVAIIIAVINWAAAAAVCEHTRTLPSRWPLGRLRARNVGCAWKPAQENSGASINPKSTGSNPHTFLLASHPFASPDPHSFRLSLPKTHISVIYVRSLSLPC